MSTEFPKPVSSGPSVKEKAAAFDALCAEFSGRAKFVGNKRVLMTRTTGAPSWPTTDEEVKYRDVPIYEWVLRADGCSDFASVAIGMGKASGKVSA